jgi:predicted kinase
MQKVIVCIGIPASGKSTFARELVKNDITFRRINKDDLRLMLGIEDYGSTSFANLNELTEKILLQLLKQGHNVIIDCTNINLATRNKLMAVCQDYGNIEYSEKVFPITLEEALQRNSLRVGVARVPDNVICDMHKSFQKAKKLGRTAIFSRPKPAITQGLSKAVIFDLDGTLADISHRNPYDASQADKDPAIFQVAELCQYYYYDDYRILFVSGRLEKDREPTISFIRTKVLWPDAAYHLYMRKDGDQRRDVEVKSEIFETKIRDQYDIHAVFDDRNQVVNLWRQLGFKTFQVADGDF